MTRRVIVGIVLIGVAAVYLGTGWVVVAVWDSKGAWDEFRDKTLLPGLQGLGDSGLAGPPKGTEFDDEAS